ncbi:uncharacterized protein JCM6883_001587 [Sporobolomyces salmoneus]|uniref:uncharacterized protein n=1 Tax=Sporobolomyces salmoneus TaxID=183962 RepID=UPI0031773C2B
MRGRHHGRYSSTTSDSSDEDTDSSSTSDNSDSSSSSSSSVSEYSDDEDHSTSGLSKSLRRVLVAVVLFLLLIALVVLFGIATENSELANFDKPTHSTSSSRTSRVSSSTRASTTQTSSPPAATCSKALKVSRALPEKMRGVNVAYLFIIEPWMMPETWAKLDCGDLRSEWDCNEKNGLERMQSLYEEHWESFYSAADFEEMKALGLNSVRIPVGYWIIDFLIGADLFASGSFSYLKQILRWCKENSLAVVLDLHSVPGIAAKEESFAGRITDDPQFFNEDNYAKSYEILRNLTISTHCDEDFSTGKSLFRSQLYLKITDPQTPVVVMLMTINEPLQDPSTSLTSTYYPGAQKAIREAEESVGIRCKDDFDECLGIQFMAESWGSGDPTSHVDTDDKVFFDDHNYAQWILSEGHTTENYLNYACKNSRSSKYFAITAFLGLSSHLVNL